MAAPTTAVPFSLSTQLASAPATVQTRRRITPQAGHALEILGHSIEYLTDEYVHQGGSLDVNDGQLTAIQLLMAANRKIYFECPTVPTFAERCQAFFGLKAS